MFGVHGALWGNAMTWWDHDTGSIWSQPLGEAIAGPRTGETVELFPMTFTSWDAWRAEHPDTLALDAPGTRTGFDLEGLYLVVDFATETAAYPVRDLWGEGVLNDTVADVPIAVLVDPTDPERWKVFSRTLDDGVEVTLRLDDRRLVDEVTGSEFDPALGIATSGPLAGQILDPLPALTSFPGDYGTFWPDGRVWPDGAEG